MEKFSVQIFSIEYNLTKPIDKLNAAYCPLLNRNIKCLLPEIVIFGSTSALQKACLHVHNCFPYFMVPYPEDLQNDSVTSSKFMVDFAKEIESLLRVTPKSDAQYIHHMEIVKGFPFYGYAPEEKLFIRIYVYHPNNVAKIAHILQTGRVFDRNFLIFEAHVPYTLQFMIDNNLYGMDYVDMKDIKFRYPLPETSLENQVNRQNVLEKFVQGPNILKISSCVLEIDCYLENIMNREYIIKTPLKSNNHDLKLVASLNNICEEERARRRKLQMHSSQPTQVQPITGRKIPEKTEIEKILYERLDEIAQEDEIPDIQYTNPMMTQKNFSLQQDHEETIDMLDWMRNQDSVQKKMTQKEYLEDQKDIADLMDMTMNQNFDTEEIEQVDGTVDEILQGDIVLLRSQETDPFIGYVLKRKENKIKVQWFLRPKDVHQEETWHHPRELFITQSVDWNKVSTVIDKIRLVDYLTFQNDKDNVKESVFFCRYEYVANEYTYKTLSKELEEMLWKPVLAPNTPSPIHQSLRLDEILESTPVSSPADEIPVEHNESFIFQTPEPKPVCRKVETPETPNLIVTTSHVTYQQPFYSRLEDAMHAQKSKYSLDHIPKFKDVDIVFSHTPSEGEFVLKYSKPPPTLEEMKETEKEKKSNPMKIGFKAENHSEDVSIISVEIHVNTRGNLQPDPNFDSLQAIFYSFQSRMDNETGILILGKPRPHLIKKNPQYFETEINLIKSFVDLIQKLDPDIIVGFENQKSSIGYIMERYYYVYGCNLLDELSRTPLLEKLIRTDEHGRKKQSGMRCTGRLIINAWRTLKDLKLRSHTIQNVAYMTLNIRIPDLTFQSQTKLYQDNNGFSQHVIFKYHMVRTQLTLDLLDHMDFIHRTSVLAKVYGLDFFSVVTRGSQFRVEGMMLRLSSPRSFFAFSPSKEQVGRQHDTECVAMVMEPEAKLYTSPVVVLDFQSLYPSMMIAYNLCFSTCLGKLSRSHKFGTMIDFEVPRGILAKLKDEILVTPNGVMFVKPEIRAGILPRMLKEILDTRIMVKKALKKSTDPVHQKALDARQVGLKNIANVTYGYTAAGFSGRMPCIDLADAIVQMGRDTLEKAIRTIENGPWNAHVCYGDTDSLFIHLEGRTREEAFKIGREIASVITKQNPEPVLLQFEKIYQPCFLFTKKRYCGYLWEDEKQTIPKFDAKGIETVRRDSCPLVAKVMEEAIRILFDTMDVSKLKKYVQKKFVEVQTNLVNPRELLFHKGVKLGEYKEILPPAAIVATRMMKKDPRTEPLYKERVPYIVIYKDPKSKLKEMVMHPLEAMEHQIHGLYYITKQLIPSLDRVFSLIHVDVNSWFLQLPKIKFTEKVTRQTLDSFFLKKTCSVCKVEKCEPQKGVCTKCLNSIHKTLYVVSSQQHQYLQEKRILCEICQGCIGTKYLESQCSSLDCDVWYMKQKLQDQLKNVNLILENLK